ncbi:tRNA epoxyqueuosine(34) reductase QueG [Sphaerotilus mobilis]|uniref:tRNA epoxyqueuosine(34) reductase QueG n=1 Tax=Sphaerotilus mobilis TaxID=47994 RepID=UPI00102B2665|nr:tRNA epoxyqueuosine(34) reductase QueG [Sphaerotilus mobilis]
MRGWAGALGFSQIGVADVDLASAEPGLLAWLQAGFHGQMHYMAAHGLRRARPAELVPGTVRVLSVRADYLPRDTPEDWRDRERTRLSRPDEAVVSVYARGRDYHKVVRHRLQQLSDRIAAEIGPHGHRVFCDSAPVLEVELARRAAIGWRGKHTLLLDRGHGSMFFLGEIYVDLALPVTPVLAGKADEHGPVDVQGSCGSCTACLSACPTQAIVAPYRLDARRCISYLTIEHDGPIPTELRSSMGNRIYGCDDCQLACPWNKYAQVSALPDFDVRAPFVAPTLLALWDWDEATFLHRTEGSAIRRIGHTRWRRNLAIALGNAWRETGDAAIAAALQSAIDAGLDDAVLAEHLAWALAQRA